MGNSSSAHRSEKHATSTGKTLAVDNGTTVQRYNGTTGHNEATCLPQRRSQRLEATTYRYKGVAWPPRTHPRRPRQGSRQVYSQRRPSADDPDGGRSNLEGVKGGLEKERPIRETKKRKARKECNNAPSKGRQEASPGLCYMQPPDRQQPASTVASPPPPRSVTSTHILGPVFVRTCAYTHPPSPCRLRRWQRCPTRARTAALAGHPPLPDSV